MTKQKKIFLIGISFLFLTGIHLEAISAPQKANNDTGAGKL